MRKRCVLAVGCGVIILGVLLRSASHQPTAVSSNSRTLDILRMHPEDVENLRTEDSTTAEQHTQQISPLRQAQESQLMNATTNKQHLSVANVTTMSSEWPWASSSDPCVRKRYIKLVGEHNTGTNWLGILLANNVDPCHEILGGSVTKPYPEWTKPGTDQRAWLPVLSAEARAAKVVSSKLKEIQQQRRLRAYQTLRSLLPVLNHNAGSSDRSYDKEVCLHVVPHCLISVCMWYLTASSRWLTALCLKP